MKLNIIERKVTINDSTKEKLERKLEKFDKFFGDGAVATATFKTQRDRIYLEISINAGDMNIRAESEDPDAKTAIDKIIGTIEGQFRKYKTKLEKKVRSGAYESYFETESDYDTEDQAEFTVVKNKKIFVKPMSVDEAILQMNLLNHEFFVYTDADTEKVSIVYKRKDKNYGLIEVY